MSLETTTTNSSSASASTSASVADLERQIEQARADLWKAAKAKSQSLFLEIKQQVIKMQADWQQTSKNFNTELAQPIVSKLEELYEIIKHEPSDPNDPAIQQKNEEKAAAERSVKIFLKQIRTALSNKAEEKALAKAEVTQQTLEASHLADQKLAKRIQETLGEMAEEKNAFVRQQNPNQTDGAQKTAQRFQELIQSRAKPNESKQNGHPNSNTANPEKPSRVVKTAVQPKLTARDGQETPEALVEAVEQPETELVSTSETSETADADSENAITEADLPTEADVELAQRSVEVALASGLLKGPQLLLNPFKNPIETMREIQSEANALLDESENNAEALGSAAVFVLRGAFRHARLRLFAALGQGQLRDGSAEDILAQVKSKLKLGERIKNGEAGLSTIPEQVRENGEISAPKSREQLHAFLGNTSNAFDVDTETDKRKFSFREWNANTRKNTVAGWGRLHIKEILEK